ncbi:MAG: peptide chain release factor 1 [Candidatus Latescibacteria bacterium]|nr:peptide chain release factor 1 [Candidatus Latescibacterota bacterium]
MWQAKLDRLEQRYEELDRLLADSAVAFDQARLREYGKEYHNLSTMIARYRQYKTLVREIEAAQQLMLDATGDAELVELAQAELADLEPKRAALENQLQEWLVPQDPDDAKNAIVEIRAGTGGDEAGLFAGNLYRMYTRYAELHGWRTETMSSSPSEKGGVKEVIILVEGQGAYGRLKHESGVHRVQRVPETETQGRIHTSAASVVVLPEAEEVDIEIDPNDLRIDVFRSSGPGGQSVNTTDSAVRVTHLPTGLVVTCQDEKSQHKNKAKALKVLRARLLDLARQDQEMKISQARRSQIRTGDRSEKIRTYNFPQGRVTDHRIGLTLYKIDQVLEGELDEVIQALAQADRTEKMAEKEAIPAR